VIMVLAVDEEGDGDFGIDADAAEVLEVGPTAKVRRYAPELPSGHRSRQRPSWSVALSCRLVQPDGGFFLDANGDAGCRLSEHGVEDMCGDGAHA
jgi:hypothetical protein